MVNKKESLSSQEIFETAYAKFVKIWNKQFPSGFDPKKRSSFQIGSIDGQLACGMCGGFEMADPQAFFYMP